MTSNVRPATEQDIHGLIQLGRRFHQAAAMPGVFSPGAFGGFCHFLINDDNGCLFVSPHGMIGGLISPLPWDSTFKVADESFWWAEDGCGVELVQAYEDWARPRADEVRMALLTNMRPAATGKLLSRLGYMAVEMGMVKKW